MALQETAGHLHRGQGLWGSLDTGSASSGTTSVGRLCRCPALPALQQLPREPAVSLPDSASCLCHTPLTSLAWAFPAAAEAADLLGAHAQMLACPLRHRELLPCTHSQTYLPCCADMASTGLPWKCRRLNVLGSESDS